MSARRPSTAREGTLITDAGSTKQAIVAALDEGLPRGCRFLGSHPLAGSEKTGAATPTADLFDGRVAILTPTKNTRAEDFDLLEQFWQRLGSVVVQMSPDEHDRALAADQPPAARGGGGPGRARCRSSISGCRARGLLDTTRLAGGDPDLWKQILLQNRDNVLTALEQYGAKLVRPARRPARRQRGRTGTIPHPREEEPRCFGKLTFIRPTASPTCWAAKWPRRPPNWAWPATWPSPPPAAT